MRIRDPVPGPKSGTIERENVTTGNRRLRFEEGGWKKKNRWNRKNQGSWSLFTSVECFFGNDEYFFQGLPAFFVVVVKGQEVEPLTALSSFITIIQIDGDRSILRYYSERVSNKFAVIGKWALE